MKTITNVLGITFACLLPLAAQDAPAANAGDGKPPNGPSDKIATPGKVFRADDRMAVNRFFHTSKDQPYGVPPGWSEPTTEGVPLMWRTGRIGVGEMIAEDSRGKLLSAPADLVAVLPKPVEGNRYYLAGSNVIAVNGEYRVLDSIYVSTIKYSATEGEHDKEASTGGPSDKDAPLGRDGKQGLGAKDQKSTEGGSTAQGDADITEKHSGRDGQQGKKEGE